MKKIFFIALLVVFAGCTESETEKIEPLSFTESQAITLAIDDEYRAKAAYGAAISEFGLVNPFANILEAEELHIQALEALFVKYSIVIPENSWRSGDNKFSSLKDACEQAVQAELRNIELYENLKTRTSRQDLITVFDSVQGASRNHLSSFQNCAVR